MCGSCPDVLAVLVVMSANVRTVLVWVSGLHGKAATVVSILINTV